jgi:hypothetical protein
VLRCQLTQKIDGLEGKPPGICWPYIGHFPVEHLVLPRNLTQIEAEKCGIWTVQIRGQCSEEGSIAEAVPDSSVISITEQIIGIREPCEPWRQMAEQSTTVRVCCEHNGMASSLESSCHIPRDLSVRAGESAVDSSRSITPHRVDQTEQRQPRLEQCAGLGLCRRSDSPSL